MASKLYRKGERISNKQMNSFAHRTQIHLPPMELQYLAARQQTEENVILFLSGYLTNCRTQELHPDQADATH